MNKTELIQHISTEAGLNKTQATAALQAFETAVVSTLVNGETLELKGFGTFKITDRAERQGRNPKTGEALTIAASKTPVFKAGKTLKDAVN
ncbi:DNA-binding protein HU [Acinetobacter sp. ANC 4470]|uniref:HU family DNA-binding protein n=1 Tax=Acinetobacter sp. ANC 4470 TaxID=1977881 RepID=UPI000A335CFB|nr:HU family DNA-binding protein [Acinetobacter sp. ANC 4470]OTG68287.1 DNA-binding protein HU [Acinetobacter sp. ANC 4470]